VTRLREKFIPTVTMLTAGAIVSITCIIKDVDTLYSLKVLLGTLILFYIIGLIGRKIILSVITVTPQQAEPVVERTEEEKEENGDSQQEKPAE